MKKRVLSTLSIILIGIMGIGSLPANAVTKDGLRTNDANEVIDITNDPNYSVTTGEISLKNIKFKTSGENKLILENKSRSKETEKDIKNLQKRLDEDKELREFIYSRVSSGANISNIGYSETFVKVDEFNRTVPVTKKELSRDVMGDPSEYGKLTMYTFVEPMHYQGSLYVSAYTHASWSGWGDIIGKLGPAHGEDMISISIPERFTRTFKKFWGEYAKPNKGDVKSRCTNDADRALIYAFDEVQVLTPSRNTYLDWVRIATGSKTNSLTPRTDKYTSHYVHTYESMTISPTISSAGNINFGLSSSSKAWQLSSSVNTEF